jgi:16S rRNA (uracil1498-N3)-methyltransferase
MHRFYVDRIDGDRVSLSDGEQLHHLKDVLRLKVNDAVVVFDNLGNEYAGFIESINKKQAVITVAAPKPARKPGTKLTLACAIPKGDRMDDIIDHLTQLGVARIVPLQTERVVVKLDKARREARRQRWKKIAQNAARQSQRNSLPLIDPVTDFNSLIAQTQPFDLKLIPTLSGERKIIKDVLADARPNDIVVLIGPEGDFTHEEIGLALRAGFVPVSLGDDVLRVATAAVAVASYLKFVLGD